MISDSMHMCSLSSIVILIFSAVIQSGMSMQKPIVLIVMHIPGISSCLFVEWLCLDSQSAMNTCGPDLYSKSYAILVYL